MGSNEHLSKKFYLRKLGFEPVVRIIMHNLRSWDQTSSMRIDKICTNSSFTSRRIKILGRDSGLFYPGDVDKFDFKKNRGNYYLSVCRLVQIKE